MTATEFESMVLFEGERALPSHPCRFKDIIWVKRNLNVFLVQLEGAHGVIAVEDQARLREYLSIWKSHELGCIRDAAQVSLIALSGSP